MDGECDAADVRDGICDVANRALRTAWAPLVDAVKLVTIRLPNILVVLSDADTTDASVVGAYGVPTALAAAFPLESSAQQNAHAIYIPPMSTDATTTCLRDCASGEFLLNGYKVSLNTSLF